MFFNSMARWIMLVGFYKLNHLFISRHPSIFLCHRFSSLFPVVFRRAYCLVCCDTIATISPSTIFISIGSRCLVAFSFRLSVSLQFHFILFSLTILIPIMYNINRMKIYKNIGKTHCRLILRMLIDFKFFHFCI